MDAHVFLKGQRVISPEGDGEVIDGIGDNIVIKLDKGATETFPCGHLREINNAGTIIYNNQIAMKRILTPVVILTIATLFSSCSAIAGIFKAGAIVGVIAVVIVIAIIIWIISMFRSKN